MSGSEKYALEEMQRMEKRVSICIHVFWTSSMLALVLLPGQIFRHFGGFRVQKACCANEALHGDASKGLGYWLGFRGEGIGSRA